MRPPRGRRGAAGPAARLPAGTAVALAAALVSAGVTGCGVAYPRLSNHSVSDCWQAVPVAHAAVHDSRATVIGVHRVPVDSVVGELSSSARATLVGDNDTAVCAVALHGDFASGQVSLATAGESGHYAIVLVSARRLRVLASVVVNDLPNALGRRFF